MLSVTGTEEGQVRSQMITEAEQLCNDLATEEVHYQLDKIE